jgi:apolipoprotein N-acyltransferase
VTEAPPTSKTIRAASQALSGRGAFALATLCALLCWLAFIGSLKETGIWPLSFVCWVPFIVAIHGQTPKRAFWIGLFAGTLMIAGGFSWIVGMLRTFSGFPTALCILFASLLWIYQGGRAAFVAWITARGTARGWPRALVFGGAFVASELVYPLLFPYYFGVALHRVPVLLQVAELGGPVAVTVVVIATNLALAELVFARLGAPADRRVVQGGAGILGFALLYGLVRIFMVDAAVAKAEAVHVGLVQGNLGLMQKRTDPADALRRHKKLTQELKAKGAELVVWSESSVTFAVPEEMYKDFYKARVSRDLGVPTIFGAVVFRVDPDRERWFNTALSSDAEGTIRGRYDKQFLLAFGEYLPFGEAFPKLYEWSPNSGRFSPGTRFDPMPIVTKTGEHKVAVLICYEDISPGFVNKLVSASDPELLVNMTNDAWFGDTPEPWQHLALAQLRAVEQRRYLIRSTNSGVSAIIDPLGRMVAHTQVQDVQKESIDHADALDAEVHWLRTTTPYALWGDGPWWAVTALAIGSAFRRRRLPGETKNTSNSKDLKKN